jgi:hypothetical protein
MTFVLAWTVGDAQKCLSCQSLYQVHFVSSMSSDIITVVVGHCDQMWYHEKVGNGASRNFEFLLLPFPLMVWFLFPLLCTELFWKLSRM